MSKQVTRRGFLKGAAAGAVGVASLGVFGPALAVPGEGETRALHEECIVIDTHNDSMGRVVDSTTWMPVKDPGELISNAKLDFVKMKEGGLDVGYFAAWTPGYTDKDRANSRALALNNALWWSAAMNQDTFGLATTSAEIRELAAQGKSIGVATIEGAYFLEEYNAAELLRQYYDLGVRAMSLCWSNSNSLGAGVNYAYPDGSESPAGLTELGAQVTREQVKLGIIIDVSHLSDETFWDIVNLNTGAPIMATHSGCWGVYEHARNMKDDMLLAVRDSGGVVQINFYAGYLGPEGQQGLKEVLDHLDYAVDLIGMDHVGLGADYDGGPMPEEVTNASFYYRVTEGLVERGYSDEDIRKILGENTLRVMDAAQALAELPPVSEEISIYPKLDMGEPFDSWLPLLEAKVVGEPASCRVIIDGIAVEPSFDADSGILSYQVAEPIVERLHVVTFEATDAAGAIARATRIFCSKEDARQVHAESIVIDTHNDSMGRVIDRSTWMPVNNPGSVIENAQLDFTKMKSGGLDVGYFAAWGPGYVQPGRSNSKALALNNALWWSAAMNQDTFGLATTSAEIRELAAQGKSIGVATIEGAYFLEEYNAAELLRQYYDLGVRAMSLCWSNSNSLGAGVNYAYPDGSESPAGLTELGAQVTREQVKLGIIIDVSHLSDETFWDIVNLNTGAPIMATHSGCWGVYEHARNMKDDMLLAVRDSGGVVQINFYAGYLGPEGQQGLKEVLDHLDYAVDLIGVDHVGLGADFDGGPMPAEVSNASFYYRVTNELVRRGYSKEDIRKILGENTLRVMEAAEALAELPAQAEDIVIAPAFAMGDGFESAMPELSAVVEGDAVSFRAIIDGIVMEPGFDADSGVLTVQPEEELVEKFHVVTFEAANADGETARATRIFYIGSSEDPSQPE